MSSPRRPLRRSTILLSILALLSLFIGPAVASGHDKELTFNQANLLPLAAADFSDVQEECEGVDTSVEDGWVFIHPPVPRGGFTLLNVTFSPSGTQTLSDAVHSNTQGSKVTFTTAKGELLTDATARGLRAGQDHFVLTHTCVAAAPEGSILIAKTYTVPPNESQVSEFQAFDDDGAGNPVPSTGRAMTHTQVGDTHYFCVDGLAFGDYVVRETFTPDGFAPAPDTPVTVDEESNCADRLLAPDPDASITNEPSPVDLTVTKLKLSWDEAANEGAGGYVETNTPLANFEYTLYEGTDDTGTLVETSTTAADGTTSFSSGILEVGETYTVCETAVPAGQEGYWTAPDEPCQTFTAELDTDVSLTFYNAPRADVTVEFFDVTGYTSAEIVCLDADGNVRASASFAANTGGGSVDLDQLDLGDYDCTIKIRNGRTD